MDDELKEFEKELEEELKKYLNNIKEDIKKIFQQAIQDKVYDYYQTNTYRRSGELRDSVAVEIKNNTIYVYNDVNDMWYESAVDGRNVTNIVPWLVNEGHSDGVGDNQYHNFEGRHYLEEAYEKIKKKYPDLDIEIVNDKPPYF